MFRFKNVATVVSKYKILFLNRMGVEMAWQKLIVVKYEEQTLVSFYVNSTI